MSLSYRPVADKHFVLPSAVRARFPDKRYGYRQEDFWSTGLYFHTLPCSGQRFAVRPRPLPVSEEGGAKTNEHSPMTMQDLTAMPSGAVCCDIGKDYSVAPAGKSSFESDRPPDFVEKRAAIAHKKDLPSSEKDQLTPRMPVVRKSKPPPISMSVKDEESVHIAAEAISVAPMPSLDKQQRFLQGRSHQISNPPDPPDPHPPDVGGHPSVSPPQSQRKSNGAYGADAMRFVINWARIFSNPEIIDQRPVDIVMPTLPPLTKPPPENKPTNLVTAVAPVQKARPVMLDADIYVPRSEVEDEYYPDLEDGLQGSDWYGDKRGFVFCLLWASRFGNQRAPPI